MRDMFEIKKYELILRDCNIETWDDLAYSIRRGKVKEVMEMTKGNYKFNAAVRFRETGE